MEESLSKTACTSVFKDGRSTTTREAYTRIWISLINQKEQNRLPAP